MSDTVDVPMPRLSESMEQGTILSWLVATGEAGEIGQEIVEIETDKATMACTAEAAGTSEIIAPEGSPLAVGELIARIGDGAGIAPPEVPKPREQPAVLVAAEPAPAQAAAHRNGHQTS